MIPAERYPELRCPMCLGVGLRAVQCEGLTEKSTLTLKFRTQAGFDTQMGAFCCGKYQNCEVYQAIMKAKYADALEAGL